MNRVFILATTMALAACGGSDGKGQPAEVIGQLLSAHGLNHQTVFSVAEGATGLPESGVAGVAPNAHSHLFISANKGPAEVAGQNTVLAVPEDLDLAATDDVNAVSTFHVLNAPSPYYFSVFDEASADEGLAGTGVRKESDEAEDPGDVFYSAGFGNKPTPGRNFLFTDEVRLALQPLETGGTPKDDLNAVDFPNTNPPGRVYFSVNRDTAGIETVAGVAATERPCTVFTTELGSQLVEVAYTCAQLGLAAGDNIDGLIVRGSTNPGEVLFSVDAMSAGAGGTAVATEAMGDGAQADIFRSTGDNMNALVVEEVSLGLEDTPTPDELDALTVADLTLEGYITRLPPLREDPPPYTDPPEGVDPGDRDAYLELWELSLLGGPANTVTYEGGETVAHPCTSCGITATSPSASSSLVGSRFYYVPIPTAAELFSQDGPLAGHGQSNDPNLVVQGDCAQVSPACDFSTDACKYYIGVSTFQAPIEFINDRKQERVCAFHLRDQPYSSSSFPKDLFTNSTAIYSQRLNGTSWQQEVLSVGGSTPDAIQSIPAQSCGFTYRDKTVYILNSNDLVSGGAANQFDLVDYSPGYSCFAFDAPLSDPFGTSTGDYGLSTAPKGDEYYNHYRITPSCAWAGTVNVTLVGAGFEDTGELANAPNFIDVSGCPNFINDDE